jgi:ABC-type branched-subunit amino acid transport system ATPase component
MPALATENITAGYGRNVIISNISVSCEIGTITTIIGPNGAGKSTFAKTLVGILRTQTGSIMVNDKDITKMPGHLIPRNGLVYVPQNDNVFVNLTVRENLEMGGYTRRHGVAERIHELCELFPDIEKSLRRKAGALSGGQRSMLAMARGLMLDPEVMLLDEPSAGLSPIFQSALWEQIETVASTGVGVCVVEQNTRRSLRHAHWGYVMVLGKNRLDGPAEALLHDEEVIDLYVGRLS